MLASDALITTAALFAGAGGLEHGLAKAGFRAVLAADSDPAAQAVLKARFPDTKIVGDVGKLTSLPDVDLVTAGFPCQDLSMAGTKAGLTGKKSSAVEHLFSLLEEFRVPKVLIENVYFMLHLDRGAAMHRLVLQLEKLGYRWAYRIIDSRAFGVPQRRRRVFLLAMLDGDPGDILFGDDAGRTEEAYPSLDAPIGFYWTEGSSGNGLTRDAIPPLKSGSSIGIASPPAVLFPDGGVKRPTIETAELLQGLPVDWTKPAADAGLPRMRWRLVGNAVSSPVATWLGERIKSPVSALGSTKEVSAGAPWPVACFGENGRRWARDVSERPLAIPAPSLLSYEETGWDQLSLRALSGFISRARGSSLRYPPGFLEALEAAQARIRS